MNQSCRPLVEGIGPLMNDRHRVSFLRSARGSRSKYCSAKRGLVCGGVGCGRRNPASNIDQVDPAFHASEFTTSIPEGNRTPLDRRDHHIQSRSRRLRYSPNRYAIPPIAAPPNRIIATTSQFKIHFPSCCTCNLTLDPCCVCTLSSQVAVSHLLTSRNREGIHDQCEHNANNI